LAVGTRFFGKYEHSLDAKGRVILPAKLRTHFNQPGYLAQHHEGCLALWTVEEFDVEVELQLALAGTDPIPRNRVREWASAVWEAEIDRQGRMAIPSDLRAFAGLDSEVVIVGVINHVEIWSPTAWATKDLGGDHGAAVTGR
jgi:MraZ protein